MGDLKERGVNRDGRGGLNTAVTVCKAGNSFSQSDRTYRM